MIEDVPPPAGQVPPPSAFPIERGNAISGEHSVSVRERRQNYTEEADAFDVWNIDNVHYPSTAYIKPGWVLSYDKENDDMLYWPPTVGEGLMKDTPVIVSAAHTVYCKVMTDEFDAVLNTPGAVTIVSQTGSPPENTLADADTETPGEYWYQIADFEEDDNGDVSVKNQYQHGSPIIHRTAGATGAAGPSVETQQNTTQVQAATAFINILGTGDKACSDVLEFVARDAGTDLGMKGGGTPDKGKVVTYSGTKWTVDYVKLVDI